MVGFWALGFVLVFGLSGVYLAFPEPFLDLVDKLQPPTPVNAGYGSAIVCFIGSRTCISAGFRFRTVPAHAYLACFRHNSSKGKCLAAASTV